MSIYYIIISMIDGFEAFINLAVMVLTIIASWIMYAKAGEPGWAAIVPFYSSYVRFKIAGKKKLFWGYLVAEGDFSRYHLNLHPARTGMPP